jgi:DNA repair exonuclease SbcCD ATPase subunit
MQLMSTKISENTNIQLDLKTVVAIIMVTASFVGMYYTLQADIEEAKKLPPIEVTRLEYELKEEWNEKMILQLKDQVKMLEETSNILKEEIKITSAMLQDGTEADGKFEELQRQLEELEKRKPKTTVIVKEVEVPTKKKKW